MALYGRQVRELIGEDIEEYLLGSIDEGYIDLQKAEIFTEVLSECDRDCECKCRAIKGKFLNRTQEAKFKFDRNAFREILSNWYQGCACDLSSTQAVHRLLDVLKHNNLSKANILF